MSLKLLSVNGEIGDANFTVLHIPPPQNVCGFTQTECLM